MLYLTDAEIADLCAPLTQPAAQVRHLRALGLTVTKKPSGRPVVIRSHAEAVLSGRPHVDAASGGDGAQPAPKIDVEGFRRLIEDKRNAARRKPRPK